MIARKLQNMSIRHKLTAVIMLTSVVIMLVGIVIFVAWEQINKRREVVQALEGNAGIIAYNCRASLAFSDHDDAAKMLSALSSKKSIVFACVYDKQGQAFATYKRVGIETAIEAPGPERDGHRFESGYLSIFKQIQLDGERIGTIYLRDDMSEVQDMFARAVAVSVPIVLLALAIGFLLCVRFQKFVSGPIVSLAAVAKQFSQEKDYNLRAVKKSSDEVGSLIDAFNGMLNQIQNEINERKKAELIIRRHNETLEQTVQERTAELEKSLAEIERFNKLMIGREGRVIEMKKEVNALLAELGRNPEYQSVLEDKNNKIISLRNSL